jgi:SET domain-containing protein
MNWIIQNSSIHGVGVYLTKDMDLHEFIDVGIKSDKSITFFGSKINHSWTPNTMLVYNAFKKTYDIHTNKPIKKGTEITLDYTFTPDFIKKPPSHWK